nr:glycosylphosphatidylinositol anchor biosynthesis protein 11 [Quercus suber]
MYLTLSHSLLPDADLAMVKLRCHWHSSLKSAYSRATRERLWNLLSSSSFVHLVKPSQTTPGPSAMSAASSSAAAAAPPPPSKPIDLLSGQYSFSYSNLHPVLLLSLLAVSFPRLVADPVSTLLGLAPTVVLLQAGYCIVCLPSLGRPLPPAAASSSSSKPRPKPKPSRTASDDLWARVVVRLSRPIPPLSTPPQANPPSSPPRSR